MRTRALAFAGSLVLVAALVGCGGEDETSTAGPATTAAPPVELPVAVEVTADVPVTGTTSADVYAPVEGGPWPVVLVWHGMPPGMDAPPASRQDLAAVAGAVAEQGAVVVNSSYVALTPDAAVSTTTCSLQVAAEVAAEHGGDPERLVLVGYSAGALPAMAYALDSPLLAEPLTECGAQAATVEVRPDAVVTLAGGFDIRLVAAMTPAVAWRSATPEVLDGLDPLLLAAAGSNAEVTTWIAPAPPGGVGLATAEGSVAVHDALVAGGYESTLLDPPLATHEELAVAGTQDQERSAALVVAAVRSVG